jgi:hypothetical protein
MILQQNPEAFDQAPALSDSHYTENLAEQYDDNELNTIAQDVIEKYEQDEETRRDWRNREAEGLRLLGIIDDVGGGAPFDGASIATHPVLAESVLQFQAQAIQEFFPATGPAKVVTTPGWHPELEAQAKRVEDYLNYQYTEQMPDAFEDDDQMMLRLPLSGSCFKKVYFDPLERTVVAEFIDPSNFVAPYTARSLRKAERYTDTLYMPATEVRQRQDIGEYLSVELPLTSNVSLDQDNREVKEAIDESEGRHPDGVYDDDEHVLLQQHTMYRLPDAPDDEPKRPYIITVDKETEKVLAIRRNWRPDDEMYRKIIHFVHYKFLPGYGFYGWGLLHVMGSLAMAATGNLRALQDSAAFANMQGGLSTSRVKLPGTNKAPPPGAWIKVDATEEDIRKAFFPWQYKEPSPTMFNLMQHLDELGRRIGNVTQVGTGQENPRNAPVGTVLALIEQQNIRPGAIHKRLFNSRKKELRLVSELNALYLQNRYPYMLPDGTPQEIFAADFDDRVDVLPIADPQIISGQQRIAQAQAMVERAQAAPDLYDRKETEVRLLQALRIPNYEQVLTKDEQPQIPHLDPITENTNLQTGQPVQAYPDQDHTAHLIVHQHFYDAIDGQAEEVKQLQAATVAHMAQHRAMLYQQQMLAAMGMQMPPQGQMPPEMENQLAQMAAQAAQMMPAQPAGDPEMMKISREQDRKDVQAAAEVQRKDMQTAAEQERKTAQTLAEQQRKDAQAAAEAERKNQTALAELVRKDAMSQSDMQRMKDKNINDMLAKVAQTENDIVRKNASEQARQQASAEGATVRPGGEIPV